MPFALYHHRFQLGLAVRGLLQLGYAEEAMPLGRAMISASMNLIFIVTSGNADGWALRYWLQVSDVEKRMLEREQKLERFDPATLDHLRQDTQDAHDGAVKAAAQDGIVYPVKLKDPGQGRERKDTWTGLSDRALAGRLGLIDWYETEYDYMSTITHVQAVSLIPTGRKLMDGKLPTVGPHFQAPVATVVACTNALKYSSLAVLKHFDLVHLDPRLQQVNLQMSAGIARWRQESGANAMVEAVLGKSSVSNNETGSTPP